MQVGSAQIHATDLELAADRIKAIEIELDRLDTRARFYNEVPSREDFINQLMAWKMDLTTIQTLIITVREELPKEYENGK